MGSGATTKAKPFALTVAVPSGDYSYPVLVGAGLLDRVGVEVRRELPEAKRAVLVSDDHVMPLYGAVVRASRLLIRTG